MWELPWALVYIHASVATTLLHPFQGFQEEQTIQPNGAMALSGQAGRRRRAWVALFASRELTLPP